MKKLVLGALIVALIGSWSSPAAAQGSVTVSTAADLQAAVAAAAGSTSPVDIRIKAGTYNLPASLELSVAAGATATLRNFGDGQAILTAPFRILRTGFVTGQGSYVIKGLTLSGADTAIEHDGGHIRIEDSTFVDNLLGFYADASTANITILNSTFWENGLRCDEGSSYCGGIWLDFYRSATLTNLTVAGAGNGVGIYGLGNESVGPTTLANSMILFNQWNCNGGAPGALGTNNIEDESGDCPGSTVVGVGFQYPGFGDHGGLVPTWPLTWDATGSPVNPAIQGGDPAWCPSHDARGAIRRSPCDIGAFESSPSGFTLDSATGTGAVTFSAAPGLAAFTNFHAIDPSSLPQANLPPSVTFPFGLFEWTATVPPGQSLQVTITFPTAVAAPLQYWKFDPASGQWTAVCPLTGCAQTGPNQISLTLTDGGIGDADGVVNGSIVDPGGLGVDGNGTPSPNLALTKNLASSGATIANGSVVTYRLIASNVGAGPTTDIITITDTLHPALTFLPSGSDPRCTAAGQVVTCIGVSTLASGNAETFELSAMVSADAAPVDGSVLISNTASVATPDDSNPNDNVSNTVTLTVNGLQRPNLTMSKVIVSAGGSQANNGDTVVYRLRTQNVGAGLTTGPTTVSDSLDPRLSFVASGSDPRCAGVGQQVTCLATAAVAPGAFETFDVAVQVAANAAPANVAIQIINTASVAVANDSNTNDNASNTTTLTVNGPPAPNMTVMKMLVPFPPGHIAVHNGDVVRYRFSVVNLGNGSTGTSPIVVTDTLDPRLSFVASGSDPRCSAIGQQVTCSGTAADWANAQAEIAVQVAANAAPIAGSVTIANTATVSTANESDPSDDTSTVMLTVEGFPAPDVSIAKGFGVSATGTQLTVNNGDGVPYRLRVVNLTVGVTTGPTTVTDILDARLTFVGARSDARCSATGQVVTCIETRQLGGQGQQMETTFEVFVQVAPNVAPLGGFIQINNTATVSTPDDSNAANDTSNTAALTVFGPFPPNAQIQKRILTDGAPSIGPITVNQGASVTYQLQVINAGAGSSVGPTVVTDTLDPRLAFVAASSDYRCSAAGQVITCLITDGLFPGESAVVNITAQVSANIAPTGSPIEIFNSATVSIPQDAVPGDNTSNAVALLVRLGAATPAGMFVTVQPPDDIGAPQPITLTFSNVTSAGFTGAIPSTGGPQLPPNFQLRGQVYDITTTAQYQGVITICFTGSFVASDRLLHYENGAWEVLFGQTHSPAGGPFTELCAMTTSLSPFAVGRGVTINTPPTLSLPASITVQAEDAAGARVTFIVNASDVEDGPLAASCTPGSGSLFPVGVTTVNCTATDADGVSTSGAFTVTVVAPNNEHQPPTLTRISPDSGKRGAFHVVFLQGTGLRGKKLAVRFSGQDISVIGEVSINSTKAAALIYIKPNAVRGSRAVTVSNDFGTSNSVTFVVR